MTYRWKKLGQKIPTIPNTQNRSESTYRVLRLSHFFNKQRAYEQNKYTTTKSQEMAVTLKKVTHEETIKIDSRHLLIKMLTHHKTDTSSFGHAM